MTFLLVFSKYVLGRMRNIFPIQKSKQWYSNICISIWYSRKENNSKIKEKKENFGIEIVKKAWF